jgi:hypothetical protein
MNNTIVKDIFNNGGNTQYAGTFYLRNFKHIGINNTYLNISVPVTPGYAGGVYYVDNQTYASISLTGCSFTNITNNGYGGAIFTNSAFNFTFTTCIFSQCISTNGKGGAIFINSTGIFSYASCRFLENDAGYGASDIDHNTNILSSYSSVNFLATCSDSSSPRTLFPDGGNLDNFILGV